jgi:phage terminase large subunit-like protein
VTSTPSEPAIVPLQPPATSPIGHARDVAALPAEARSTFLAGLAPEAALLLLHDWRFWARPAQLPPPGGWRIWLIRAGRGFGKTRAGAEWVRARIESGAASRVALVGETAADAREVMVEGDSGILACAPPWNRPRHEKTRRRLLWANGAIASCYSAEDPEQLRGPQHDAAWADEVAKWRYADAWDQLMLGLRLGTDPRCVATTTLRPKRWIKTLLEDPAVAVTGGTSFENAANLAPGFLAHMRRRYAGTRLGRQELEGAYLDDTPGALWSRALIERARRPAEPRPPLVRIVVAVDPAAGGGKDGDPPSGDETGIVVAGRDAHGMGVLLADLSARFTPDGWGRRAVEAFRAWRADRIVIERNNGGEMARHVLRTVDAQVPVRTVWASRGKQARAEPVAALYEQGRIQHLGRFDALEDQMAAFLPEGVTDDGERGKPSSPDRVDALVWAMTELMLGPSGESREVLF